MAASDARPVPKKDSALRIVFPIFDADGDLVTGATGLDSEISKDQGTFADCTNEATEIATSSGMYYLDITQAEMNADCVAIIVKTSSVGAKTTPIVLYPQEGGDIRVDVTTWLGQTVPAADTAGYPKVTIKNGTGSGELATTSGGVALTTAGNTAVVDALYASTAENNGTITFKQAIRYLLSVVLGRDTISGSTVTFKTPDNAKTRVTTVTDSSNQRTSVTLDGTD
jgi:hypothetical protein